MLSQNIKNYNGFSFENCNTRTVTEDGYSVDGGQFGTRVVALYARGEAVAVSNSSGASSRSLSRFCGFHIITLCEVRAYTIIYLTYSVSM